MPKYFDKNEIIAKALKLYTSGKLFVDFIENGELFPLVIPLKKIKQRDIQNDFSAIFRESELLIQSNLDLTCKAFEFKNLGTQTLPIKVNFVKRVQLLALIQKEEEFSAYCKVYETLTCKYSQLKALLIKKPNLIVENLYIWDKLLSVCDFFITHPRANIYIRELAIEGIDSKFIEKNKSVIDKLLSSILSDFDESISSFKDFGFERKYHLNYPLPQVRFRILDKRQLISGLDDLSIDIGAFKKLNLTCKHVFIVENKMTTLSFPSFKDAIVIFGSGYGAQVLKDVVWLQDKNLYYWGDIDADGFAILSQMRSYFPAIISLFMDEETVQDFSHFSVVNSELSPLKQLEHLDPEEQKLYEKVHKNQFRLEQERINFKYVREKLNLLTFTFIWAT